MVKCLPEFEYFTVFLKNKNIIFEIRSSKVTDYAALKHLLKILGLIPYAKIYCYGDITHGDDTLPYRGSCYLRC